MSYEYKNWPEAVRAVIIAVLTVLGASLMQISLATDIRTWAAGVLVGAAHAGAMAILAWLTKAEASDAAGGSPS